MPEGDDIVIEGMLAEEGVDPVFGAGELEEGRQLRIGSGSPYSRSRDRPGLEALRGTDEYKRFFQANMSRLEGVDVLPDLPDWSGSSDPRWGSNPYKVDMPEGERVRKLALAEALLGEYSRRGMSGKVEEFLDWMSVDEDPIDTGDL